MRTQDQQLSAGVNAFCRCRVPNTPHPPFLGLLHGQTSDVQSLNRGGFVTHVSDPERRQNIKTRRFYLNPSSRALGCATQRPRPVMDQL